MVAAFTLIPASLSGHGLCKAFYFSDGYPVPTTKRLEGEGGEGHTLPGTFVFSSPHLPVKGKIEAKARGGCCSIYCGLLQGVDDCDVEGSIEASRPIRDENVCRPAISSRK